MVGLQEVMSKKQPFTYYSVFLDVDGDTIIERIRNRAIISEEELSIRIENARHESLLAKKYCHHIINANQTIENVTQDFMNYVATKMK
jgi:dephospho-CoA kinase